MMNIRKTLVSAFVVALASVSMAAMAVEHDANSEAKSFIRLSEDGSTAARTISLARVAIFDGQPKEAADLVAKAKTSLEAAAKDTDKLAIKPPKDNKQEGPMVPIDARLTVADTYAMTPKMAKDIDKVNEHLKNGDTQKALETLRPMDVQLTLTSLFMPLDTTVKAVDQAAKLLTENKYYEANLVLKNAEDSWVVDSQSFVDYLASLPNNGKTADKAKAPEKTTSTETTTPPTETQSATQ
ncbi:MAG: YfdX family protein [Gammaproteobacteria bacterium]|nr:YfdX family protein [Gammaproteobacteria bacterium]MCP5458308.1 YfdX family protein [Gammaproteobacteria bacterium]